MGLEVLSDCGRWVAFYPLVSPLSTPWCLLDPDQPDTRPAESLLSASRVYGRYRLGAAWVYGSHSTDKLRLSVTVDLDAE